MQKNSPFRRHITLRYVLIVGVLLLVANIVLGVVLLNQSKKVMQTLIAKNMLDVSDSAAGFMDGDEMRELTAADVGGPTFNRIAETLSVFAKKVDIRYIYAIRKISDDKFVFTVDPDPVDPGKFGEENVITAALISAGNGVAAVDREPYTDRWGTFYTSYSPVFDSNGDVTAIIGVDFGLEWYDDQVNRYTRTIIMITALTALTGILVMFLIMNRLARRFDELEDELVSLSRELDVLGDTILPNESPSGNADEDSPFRQPATKNDPDEIEQLNNKVRTMHGDIAAYLDNLRSQAKTDALTGISNSSAYHELEKELEKEMEKGDTSFVLTIFDLNDLKGINDVYGHSTGDEVIKNAARILAVVFGKDRTFRIGGDEFAVVMKNTSEAELSEYFTMYEHGIDSYNKAKPNDVPAVLMAHGTAFYRPGEDKAFLDVFKRADEAMYVSKARFYTGQKDRRKRSE